MKTQRIFALLTGIVLLISTPAISQETEKTKVGPADHSIDDFAWIAGHWRGEALGGAFEETWNPPFGGTMMGMFKFVKDDNVGFYEIITLLKENDTWLVRLKHFDNSLVGWEEKGESMEFPLVSLSDSEAIFDGLKFLKIDENTMHILVTTKHGDDVQELKFVCKRAEATEK